MFYGEEVERIDLGRSYPHVERTWVNGDPWASKTVQIVLGRLPDGRWYVTTLSQCVPWATWPGCAYDGPYAEHYARGTARHWRRTFGGEWA